MNYIIFDLEWNQPPTEEATITTPLYLTGEIVQLGAVKLNDRFAPVDEKRLYITPQYYTKMHRKIASLTGIHDRDLKAQGQPFPEAFREFLDWCGEEYAYMTWSMSDLPMLVENMQLHGIPTDNLPVCYDVQRIFGREIMRSDRRYALDHALEILGERGDTSHDALHDARNTVIVCNHLDLEEFLPEYAARAFASEPCDTVYDSSSALLEEPAFTAFSCPWCGEQTVGESWLPYGPGEFMTMARCPQGDELFVHLERLPLPGGRFRAKRMLYDMSDDLWEVYQDALEGQQV